MAIGNNLWFTTKIIFPNATTYPQAVARISVGNDSPLKKLSVGIMPMTCSSHFKYSMTQYHYMMNSSATK